ncbi:lactosylceramide 4-alpha-galactosyltransferase [Klebsormidium nitens]|uniref:Lactosylceramide 4-alpha-galactosyltransferase n=1 Tax=Klebsormidium nitens TaxID=105231 RepID=A0A1Y1HPZ7_KLENI|nr:lactosylceramide 4-alpha-galactosyltransferase [Klebsormidium nitens]|eukprot:GAQ80700.1 lactosylceramide 4-alpha-galactosyltransferase [Klebsormidium nitens]
MNTPPQSIMQLVLWLVILSTFCYTWLSSEPFLNFRVRPAEDGAPPVDIAAIPSSAVAEDPALAEQAAGESAEGLEISWVKEERENSVKLEVSREVFQKEMSSAEDSGSGSGEKRAGRSKSEMKESDALGKESNTTEGSNREGAASFSELEVSSKNQEAETIPAEGLEGERKKVKDGSSTAEHSPEEPGLDVQTIGNQINVETPVTDPALEMVGSPGVHQGTRPAEEPGCFHHPATGIGNVIGNYIRDTACPLTFFVFWTTTSSPNKTAKSDGFQMRHLRSVESAFVTHPTACVIFLSVLKFENRFMSELQTRGFRLLILDEFDVTSLLKYTPAEVWYKKVDEWRKGKYFFSHFTDLMRLAVLYKFGGVYIDTDCIVMNDVTGVRNAFGAQLTDGETGTHKEVDGGVMMFDRGSTFLYECMVEASGNYNQWDWEFNGPGLLKRMLARADLEGSYTVVPTMAIYPIYYRDIWAYFGVNGDAKSADEQAAFWARMRNETRVFHWYNQFARKHRAAEGSLMRAAFNEFCIFCEEVVE